MARPVHIIVALCGGIGYNCSRLNEKRINDTMAQGKHTDELELRSILQWSLEGHGE